MIFETYSYQIPSWALSALINDDYSGLDDKDIESLRIFEESLPKGLGHWSYDPEEEGFFAHYNDVTNIGGDVANLKYLVAIDLVRIYTNDPDKITSRLNSPYETIKNEKVNAFHPESNIVLTTADNIEKVFHRRLIDHWLHTFRLISHPKEN